MITLSGKGIYGGIVIGRLCFYKREAGEPPKYTVKNIDDELRRFDVALKKSVSDLKGLYKTALSEIDRESAAIFEIHGMMLEDEDFNREITDTIKKEKINAEHAIFSASVKFSSMFESMDDAYMQARGADIRDISNRVISVLLGRSSTDISAGKGDIICADDLTPSEAMSLDRSKVSAFVTSAGSASSHTAILAKSMGIPAVIGVGDDLMTLTDGAEAIVDGYSGKVYISPDLETSARMKEKRAADLQRKALLEEYKGLENITLDGKRVELFANIQCLQELPSVSSNDAGGIGLFRSEFLYMDRKDFPTEEEQYEVYKNVLSHMNGKKVIIRTLDIGADKQADYFMLDKEENPALGLRAIRICLTRPDIFRPQLRALLRASVHGTLGIMFPMISSVSELKKTLTIVDDVKRELTAKGIPFCKDTELGIMIETPAAAIISDILSPLVDFFSIGTNDLTQYTLALDRQNRQLDRFFDPHHEAVLRLIEITVNNAHAHGKWVGICGELGADTELTERFLRMGIDELSVSPSFILPLRDKIRKTNLKKEKGAKK